jgi:tRNA(fMet)-specific endonuclease VapC
MTALIDTDRVIDYLQGIPEAHALLRSLLDDGIAISIVTYAEVYEGIYYGSNPAHHERVFRNFLQGAQVLGISRAVARRLAQIRGDLRRRGLLLPMADLVIAATALEHDLALVTRNTRHFERISGLQILRR